MYPKLFGISFLNTYGLCIGIGVLACFAFVRYACKKKGIPSKFEDFVEYNAIISILVGIFSGMVFQSFYNWIDALSTNPEAKFELTFTNITFLGGLIGGVGTFLLIYFLFGRKRYGAYLIRLLPIAACCILVAHAFGRLGCFCAGCCYGKHVDAGTFGAIYFPNIADWVYPTQLWESLFLFIMFGICCFLTLKKNYKYTMNIYLITYGVFRFLIEYARGDARGTLIPGVPLYPSQILSILMLLLGISFYFIMPYIIKKYNIDFEKNDILNAEENIKIEEN